MIDEPIAGYPPAPRRRPYVISLPSEESARADLLGALGVPAGSVTPDADYFEHLFDVDFIEDVARRSPEIVYLADEDGTVPEEPRARRHRVSVSPPLVPAELADHLSAPPRVDVRHDERRMESLIDAAALRAWAAPGRRRVNLVVVDGGLDRDYLRRIAPEASLVATPLASGPPTTPRARPSRRHANLVARTALSLAPATRVWDMPLLPDRIDSVPAFATVVLPALDALIARVRKHSRESWVILCAWGLLSREYEGQALNYSDERGHLLNQKFVELAAAGADVVFSAGNNGLFYPDLRSGHIDRGPHRSILGANGLPEVLTVGAVTPLGVWIGESSQGREPDGLRPPAADAPRKPDVCAPSWWRNADDAHALVTGTSGACAVAAGVVAAVRRRVGQCDLPPAELIARLRETARPAGHSGGEARDAPASWRQGSGVIDCAALTDGLKPGFCSWLDELWALMKALSTPA